MKYTVVSDVFSGFVVLPDYMNIRQVRQFEDAFFGDIDKLQKQAEEEEERRIFLSVNDEKMLPVLLDFIQEWHLRGIPEKPELETFPQTPRAQAHALVSELSQTLYGIWKGEIEIPNE